jgi:hypothetical protein
VCVQEGAWEEQKIKRSSARGEEKRARLACRGREGKGSPVLRASPRVATPRLPSTPVAVRAPLLLCSAPSTASAVACAPVAASKLGFGCVQVCMCLRLSELCQEKKRGLGLSYGLSEEKEIRLCMACPYGVASRFMRLGGWKRVDHLISPYHLKNTWW